MHLLSCFSPAAPKGNSDRISSISYSNSGSVWQLPATSQWCAKQNFEKRLQLREVKISLKIKDLKSICLNLRTDANLSMESTEWNVNTLNLLISAVDVTYHVISNLYKNSYNLVLRFALFWFYFLEYCETTGTTLKLFLQCLPIQSKKGRGKTRNGNRSMIRTVCRLAELLDQWIAKKYF